MRHGRGQDRRRNWWTTHRKPVDFTIGANGELPDLDLENTGWDRIWAKDNMKRAPRDNYWEFSSIKESL
jgi:hypothetical protein